jgi:hypothetical protein
VNGRSGLGLVAVKLWMLCCGGELSDVATDVLEIVLVSLSGEKILSGRNHRLFHNQRFSITAYENQ